MLGDCISQQSAEGGRTIGPASTVCGGSQNTPVPHLAVLTSPGETWPSRSTYHLTPSGGGQRPQLVGDGTDGGQHCRVWTSRTGKTSEQSRMMVTHGACNGLCTTANKKPFSVATDAAEPPSET